MRLAAGCRRICKASNDRAPPTSMTSSPSRATVLNGRFWKAASTSGKKRVRDLPDLPFSSTSAPSLKTRHRNPSHLGSYSHSPDGSSSALFASIGSNSCTAVREMAILGSPTLEALFKPKISELLRSTRVLTKSGNGATHASQRQTYRDPRHQWI